MISYAHALFTVLMLSSIPIYSQSMSKQQLNDLRDEVSQGENAVATCEKLAREEQIRTYGKVLPRVSGHCWGGCPTSIPKPIYPEIAKRNRIGGEVIVDTIVNESGKVIYAKAVKGKSILRPAATEAAYHAAHQPKYTCGNRAIKFRWQIKYHFTPDN